MELKDISDKAVELFRLTAANLPPHLAKEICDVRIEEIGEQEENVQWIFFGKHEEWVIAIEYGDVELVSILGRSYRKGIVKVEAMELRTIGGSYEEPPDTDYCTFAEAPNVEWALAKILCRETEHCVMAAVEIAHHEYDKKMEAEHGGMR